MNDEDLTGYLLDALDPDERAAVEEYVRANADAAVRLEELRLAFVPLEVDREFPAPPSGLALRTLSRVAAHLAEHEPCREEPSSLEAIALAFADEAVEEEPLAVPAPHPLRAPPREEPELTAVGGRLRFDIVIAGGIALFACGLVFSAIGKVRAHNQMIACQNTLRTAHVGLTGYADTHGGRYPQVGVGPNATAETFARALTDSGHIPAGVRLGCPTVMTTPTTPVGYTYTLGYRTPGGLLGLSRGNGLSGDSALVPISADFPTPSAAPTAGPTSGHSQAMNVLFVGGHVQVTTSAFIGPNGDDIFRNLRGEVRAGKDRRDIVLGRPGDRP